MSCNLNISNFRHNAFISWPILQKVSRIEDGSKKWWSETSVSEDLELSIRMQVAGWRVQYTSYCGDGFQEGASLTFYDELRRQQRYGYGCVRFYFDKTD